MSRPMRSRPWGRAGSASSASRVTGISCAATAVAPRASRDWPERDMKRRRERPVSGLGESCMAVLQAVAGTSCMWDQVWPALIVICREISSLDNPGAACVPMLVCVLNVLFINDFIRW
ncbi:hypothetical protein D3C72_2012600 [compost metagenome]